MKSGGSVSRDVPNVFSISTISSPIRYITFFYCMVYFHKYDFLINHTNCLKSSKRIQLARCHGLSLRFNSRVISLLKLTIIGSVLQCSRAKDSRKRRKATCGALVDPYGSELRYIEATSSSTAISGMWESSMSWAASQRFAKQQAGPNEDCWQWRLQER